MLEIASTFGPIIVGLTGIIFAFLFNSQSLELQRSKERRQLILEELNKFYGPLQQLLSRNSEIHGLFKASRPNEFRTLVALLEGEVFEGNDEILLQELILVNEKIEQLILSNSGLIDDLEMSALLAKACVHYRMLSLAYKRQVRGEVWRFQDYVFPRELELKLARRIGVLQAQLKD